MAASSAEFADVQLTAPLLALYAALAVDELTSDTDDMDGLLSFVTCVTHPESANTSTKAAAHAKIFLIDSPF